jgi:hypothetical protein
VRLLFFCSTLEPGRDGVGDYTFRLALESAQRGHACAIVALHDSFVSRETEQGFGPLRIVRMPIATEMAIRLERARACVDEFEPDWVSWQFVAYGFQAKGVVPSALVRHAGQLRGPRCHVMMHELWLGLETGSGWRARIVGWRQRRSAARFLRRLRPDCLQTSNPAYRAALARQGFAAGVLELFGNVPIAGGRRDDTVRAGGPPAAGEVPREPQLVAVTFGTIHPQWNPAPTAEWMVRVARRLGRRPVLVAAGRMGTHGAAALDAFARRGVEVVVTGEQNADAISGIFTQADFGIAPHPWALIGKSGAAAAMREHGLPVLVPRDDWRLRGTRAPAAPCSDALLTRLQGLDTAATDRWLGSRRAPASALPRVAGAFLGALARAVPAPQA